MKTLIIHPQDKTTDFLKPIYENLQDATILAGEISRKQVEEHIETHDRIIMMGHGDPRGLYNMRRFKETGFYIVDDYTAPLLRGKEIIAIWCNADQYMIYNKLLGLYSGMFISEVGESYYCGLHSVDQKIVDESNNGFAKIMGQTIDKPLSEIFQYVKDQYGKLIDNNSVAKYNHERIHLKDTPYVINEIEAFMKSRGYVKGQYYKIKPSELLNDFYYFIN